jgi:hypothetical protein
MMFWQMFVPLSWKQRKSWEYMTVMKRENNLSFFPEETKETK